jgi:membrane protease YdiL (CAAX protease family)
MTNIDLSPQMDLGGCLDLVTVTVYVLLITAVLLWARWSNLDLALRPPLFKSAWPWIMLFVAWRAAEQIISLLGLGVVGMEYPPEAATALFAHILKTGFFAPLFEEILFRGAMFSAFARRWGILSALVVPNILWAGVHLQYEEPLLFLWIAVMGILLSIIRFKSGSLYLPLSLHGAHNLAAALTNHQSLSLAW